MSDQQAGMATQAHQPFADKLARAKAKGVTLATRIHSAGGGCGLFQARRRRAGFAAARHSGCGYLPASPQLDGPKPEDPQGVSV